MRDIKLQVAELEEALIERDAKINSLNGDCHKYQRYVKECKVGLDEAIAKIEERDTHIIGLEMLIAT